MERLSDLGIRALTRPVSGQVIHLDDQIPGFGVRVSQGGAKTFVLTYGKERKRVTIGRYPVVSLAQARELAKKHLAEITLGIRHATISVKSLAERYLAEKAQTIRPRTYGDYKRLLDAHMKFDTAVSDVTPQKLDAIFQKVKAPQERAHLINLTKMLFTYGEKRGYVDRSPAHGFTVIISKPRERVLTNNEIRAIWGACEDDAFGRSVKLLMLTGQRKGEIAHITLEGDLATIPGAHTKNHRTHTFPVGEMGRALLGSDLAFNGWGKAKSRLDQQAGVTDWTLHDLRRTHATIHAQLGTPPHIIEAILNHKSGIISGVAATYNRFAYIEEMRVAINKFEAYITKVLAA